MAHGGYAGHRVEGRSSIIRRTKGLGVDQRKGKKKAKSVSVKNQMRSTERMLLRKNLPVEVREAQLKKMEELKQFHELQTRLATEQKLQMREKKFFERRKIERMIRRLEKQQRSSSDPTLEGKISHQLSLLREDLEYVRFFPKSEKYVPLFVGGDNQDTIEKRNKLREQIKANRVATAASGKYLEETASDNDVVDMSEDDFFLTRSSSDEAEAEADDEWIDKSTRSMASSSGRHRAPPEVRAPPANTSSTRVKHGAQIWLGQAQIHGGRARGGGVRGGRPRRSSRRRSSAERARGVEIVFFELAMATFDLAMAVGVKSTTARTRGASSTTARTRRSCCPQKIWKHIM